YRLAEPSSSHQHRKLETRAPILSDGRGVLLGSDEVERLPPPVLFPRPHSAPRATKPRQTPRPAAALPPSWATFCPSISTRSLSNAFFAEMMSWSPLRRERV